MVAGTGHIPDVVAGIGCRGQIAGCGEHRGFGNIPGFRNVQGVSAFAELGTVSIGERERRQHSIGIISASGIPGELNRGCAAAGTAAKAGDFLRGLDCGYQTIVAGGKPRHRGRSGIVEHISGGSALVGAVPLKTIWVTQAADDFIDQNLRCYTQWHIGVAVLFCSRDTDGVVPLLVTVEKNKADSLPPSGGQRIPDVASGCTAASIQCYIPVHGIAAGAGRIIAPWLNTVQRFIRMGNTAVPRKVPAHVLDIGRRGGAVAVGFIGAGYLVVQSGSVVAVVRKVEKHDTFLPFLHINLNYAYLLLLFLLFSKVSDRFSGNLPSLRLLPASHL